MRDRHRSRKLLKIDLEALGFRFRRGHDIRRTMISLGVDDLRQRRLPGTLHLAQSSRPPRRPAPPSYRSCYRYCESSRIPAGLLVEAPGIEDGLGHP